MRGGLGRFGGGWRGEGGGSGGAMSPPKHRRKVRLLRDAHADVAAWSGMLGTGSAATRWVCEVGRGAGETGPGAGTESGRPGACLGGLGRNIEGGDASGGSFPWSPVRLRSPRSPRDLICCSRRRVRLGSCLSRFRRAWLASSSPDAWWGALALVGRLLVRSRAVLLASGAEAPSSRGAPLCRWWARPVSLADGSEGCRERCPSPPLV